MTLQEKVRKALLEQFMPNFPIHTLVQNALKPVEADFQEREREYVEGVRNLQLSKVNELVR